jgi:hypothetical protein
MNVGRQDFLFKAAKGKLIHKRIQFGDPVNIRSH